MSCAARCRWTFLALVAVGALFLVEPATAGLVFGVDAASLGVAELDVTFFIGLSLLLLAALLAAGEAVWYYEGLRERERRREEERWRVA